MRLRSAYKDWRRRRLLRAAGVGVEIDVPGWAAGARSGVWVVDPRPLHGGSVVWSAGVGDNVAWDLAMIARFGCTVHAFDPTPRALAWLRTQTLPAGFVLHPVGLAAHDGEQRFVAPAKPHDVNFRPAADPGEPSGVIQAPVRRTATLARELDHDRIDVLKLDIEGGEYDVLPDLLASGPLPLQLLVEFHHGQDGIPFAATADAIAALRRHGYRLFHQSRRGLEFSFVRNTGSP